MTQEEKEKYYAKYEICIGDITLNGVVKRSELINGVDDEAQFVLDSIHQDLDAIRNWYDEVHKVPDNLDSE